MSSEQQPSKEQQSGLGIIHMSKSVLASMFGVCSDQRRQKDFEEGNLIEFFAVGVVFVLIFIFTLLAIVDHILS
ncbi:MAG: DUF2970 domain-containing protein [Kangiellaceae bacterium]|nr:DUF2970 domain-containing protein [Kangiellaceae bacterium]